MRRKRGPYSGQEGQTLNDDHWECNAGKREGLDGDAQRATSTSKRGRIIPQPWGLVLESSNALYLKESSPQNPIPNWD